MFQQFKDWLGKQKFSSKSAAAMWVFLTGAYATVPSFALLLNTVYAHVPGPLKLFLAGVAPVVVLYYKTEKTAS